MMCTKCEAMTRACRTVHDMIGQVLMDKGETPNERNVTILLDARIILDDATGVVRPREGGANA